MKENKQIVYVDMDDTLCDFTGAYRVALDKNPGIIYPQSQFDFFRKLDPLPLALDAMEILTNRGYDVWILTRPSILNPSCYTEKRLWVEDHLGIEWCNKLIICPDKSLVKGDF
jgi:5'-nucleotidase